MSYNVRIEQADPRPLAVVRRRASLQSLTKVVPEACGAIWKVVRARAIAGAGRHVALYLDDQINLEVGVELDAPLAGDGDGVVGSSLPGGRVAAATHFGPYGRLHECHEAIRGWCAAKGYALAGPNWEVYGHWIDDWNIHPEKVRTDVYYLLAADGGTAG